MATLLSPTALSKLLSTSRTTINNWTKEGKITPEIWEGHIIRYDLEKVQAELAERARKLAEESKRKAAGSLA